MFRDSHAAINGLIAALQERDHYTKDHSDRVAALSANLGMACGLANREINILRIASLFHDIGKIGVPDYVLLKGDKLTDEELLQMQQHPIQGERIFKATGWPLHTRPLPSYVIIMKHLAAKAIRTNCKANPSRCWRASLLWPMHMTP
jgi:HD-GYP domain-containing protein (c-di-GMP phosphodiesterase class II)